MKSKTRIPKKSNAAKTQKSSPMPKPKKTREIVATHGLVNELRGEMKREFTSVRLEIKSFQKQVDARFNHVDARFNQVDARFNEIDGRFNQVDAQFKKVYSEIEKVLAAIHRTNALVEEQNARNRYVLDGYTSLYDAQQVLEKRVKDIEEDEGSGTA